MQFNLSYTIWTKNLVHGLLQKKKKDLQSGLFFIYYKCIYNRSSRLMHQFWEMSTIFTFNSNPFRDVCLSSVRTQMVCWIKNSSKTVLIICCIKDLKSFCQLYKYTQPLLNALPPLAYMCSYTHIYEHIYTNGGRAFRRKGQEGFIL